MSASTLSFSPDEEIALARKVLSCRQFDCWHAHHHEKMTLFAITKKFSMKLMTVRREIERARQKLTDAIAEAQAVRREGQVRTRITIVLGGQVEQPLDTTLDDAIRTLQHQHLARAA